jgi:hypothetical protein
VQNRETDALLDNQQAQYGAGGGGDTAQPDEEELRREREALEHITTEATEYVKHGWCSRTMSNTCLAVI